MKPLIRGWDVEAFFEKDVQALLWESRRTIEADRHETWERSWPLLVYQATSELVNESPTKTDRHVAWLRHFSQDKFFAVRLLSMLTRFYAVPESAWNQERRISHYVQTLTSPEQIPDEDWLANITPTRDSKLAEWEDIAQRLPPELFGRAEGRANRLKVAWTKATKRRLAIWKEWEHLWEDAHEWRRGFPHCPVSGCTVSN